ncbi:TolB family protein [Maribacter antarcticus]|uniref:TolB family protein n=1 Tax=Maribacter antarcticus TaxID=505250 RepID=UPI000A96CD18|nr:PD40 domain-containing protein [Maribacter antarcticus]
MLTVNTDGTNKKVLTDATPPNGSPAWSGDGKKIAYDSMKDGNFEIFTMNINGTEKK